MYFFVQVKSRRPHDGETIRARLQTARMSVRIRFRPLQFALAVFVALCSDSFAGNWQTTVSKDPAGNFPELRPLGASYRFGWSGLTAATGEVHFTKPSENKFQLDGTGRTTGLVRALWRFDVNHHAVASADTLRPIETEQSENYRSKKIVTRLTFTNSGVTRARTEGEAGAAGTKTRQFSFPNLFDLHSAMLYLRSQPLRDRSVYRVVAYPATNAYLATVTVIGREKISVRAGTYNAIKLDLQLKRINKHLQLEPHRKFRHATIWVSDDAERLLLRIEAQIFVGTVFAELQSVRFDDARS